VNSPAYLDTTVALRSLAEFKGASLDEVEAMAKHNELRKMFVRTDGPSPEKLRSAQAALAASLAMDPNASI
jgi:hypothetical protein